MGRYYSGDIEGKFWFALQDSNAADRFGSIGTEPEYLNYYYFTEHLPKVEEEIDRIEKALGDKLQVIEDFFKVHDGYNDEMLNKAGITKAELREYADLRLGKKIRDCIKEQGACIFTAEL